MAYVMIVDDDVDLANATAKVLRGAGYEVGIMTETQHVIAALSARRPDLLILDGMFPEDDWGGFELARTMRQQHEELKDLPILMLTGVNQKFQLGLDRLDIDNHWLPVTDFLEKPVDVEELLSKVAALLAK